MARVAVTGVVKDIHPAQRNAAVDRAVSREDYERTS
jgi:hypothetical protein